MGLLISGNTAVNAVDFSGKTIEYVERRSETLENVLKNARKFTLL